MLQPPPDLLHHPSKDWVCPTRLQPQQADRGGTGNGDGPEDSRSTIANATVHAVPHQAREDALPCQLAGLQKPTLRPPKLSAFQWAHLNGTQQTPAAAQAVALSACWGRGGRIQNSVLYSVLSQLGRQDGGRMAGWSASLPHLAIHITGTVISQDRAAVFLLFDLIADWRSF